MRNIFISMVILIALIACSDNSGSGERSDILADVNITDISTDYADIYVNDVSDVTSVDIEDVSEDVLYVDVSEDGSADTDIYTDIPDSEEIADFSDIYYIDADSIEDIISEDSTDISLDASQDAYADDDAISTDLSNPDFGTKMGLLFSAREKFKNKPSIFYIDPEGGTPQKLSPDLSDEFTRPLWSPDGNSFYFESAGKIYKTPFGKFEPVEICSGMDFSVSPDEKLIALNKYVQINDLGEYDYELFIYDMEKKKYTQITTFMDGEMENRPSSPSFSPDSKKILFSMLNPSGAYDVYSSDLFIYDLSTGFLMNITNEAKQIQAKVANRSSEWASDLNKYAYLHILYPESGYYLVDGLQSPKRISDQTHNGIDGIAFSPNSNALAIATGMGKGISIIDLNGNVLYELPIVDLEYIDNLSWR